MESLLGTGSIVKCFINTNFILCSQQPDERVTAIIPIVRRRKLRPRESGDALPATSLVIVQKIQPRFVCLRLMFVPIRFPATPKEMWPTDPL